MSITVPSVSMRVSRSERDLLEAAAGRTRTSLSDFVRRETAEAAEMESVDRQVMTIPAENFERFGAWAGLPAMDVPDLHALLASPPAWRD